MAKKTVPENIGVQLSPKGRPIPIWRTVQPERLGEGTLTGHRLARDVMAFASENPDESEQLIEAALRSAMLDSLSEGGDSENDHASRRWAASAFLSVMASYIAFAAQRVDFQARFESEAEYAVDLIKRLEPTNKTGPEVDQRARRAAREAIKKVMVSR